MCSPDAGLTRSKSKLQSSTGFSPLLYTPKRTCHLSPGETRPTHRLSESVMQVYESPMSEAGFSTTNDNDTRLLPSRSGGSGLVGSLTLTVISTCQFSPLWVSSKT